MAVSDAVFVACIAASGTFGGAIGTAGVALYGIWQKKRGESATADKTEQETEIRWHEEWEKQCAVNLRQQREHEAERAEWVESKRQLTVALEDVQGKVDQLTGLVNRATNQLTDCQNERLDLSRLATALHADRNRWRDAAKSLKFLLESGKRDDNLVMQANQRILEAEKGEEAVSEPDIVETAVSIIAVNTEAAPAS